MKFPNTAAILKEIVRSLCAMLLCMTLVAPGLLVFGQQQPPAKPSAHPTQSSDDDEDDDDAADTGAAAATGTAAKTGTAKTDEVKIPADQLDALVAPIALYPDPLLSQVLVASTYPLEIVQLHQWLQ